MNRETKRKFKKIKSFFDPNLINELGKSSNFVQRKSKLTALAFLKFCVFDDDEICKKSLSNLCSILRKEERTSISTEGLNLRFNDNAVGFLKSFLFDLLKKQSNVLDTDFDTIKEKFKRIRIMDSTTFSLPGNLMSFYRGNGGGASEAAVKVNLEYDLLTASFVNLKVTEGTENDGNFMWDVMHTFEKGDLCIRDLGYYSSLSFNKMNSNGIFFISKIKSSSTMYSDNLEYLCYRDGACRYIEGEPFRIDIKKVHTPLAEGETIELSNILLGRTHKTPIRLIVTKLPEDVKMNRQKKREANAKKDKIKSCRDSLDAVNVFVTNVPPGILENSLIQKMYSLRWQIEIMFKAWKSLFKINLVNKVLKVERFECFIYSKLISLLLVSLFMNTANNDVERDKMRELSLFKCYNTVRTYLVNLSKCIFGSINKFINLVAIIFDDIYHYAIKSKKKGILTCGAILNLI